MSVTAPGTTVVGQSAAMRRLAAVVERLADAVTPVLIEGESGTGKDLVAYWIHHSGERRDAPLIKIHCPSIPADLLESELFGHERGAFTDARQAKQGKIEMAAGGTLYFDQIHDLPVELQAKLLRIVEEKRFERLGGTRTMTVDVRFISSSSVDLREAMREGRFREDLYHRLGVVSLELPPLRDRRSDIIALAELFLARERERGTTRARRFGSDVAAALKGYDWPGNVRELRGVIERMVLLAPRDELPLAALPRELLDAPSSLWVGRDRRPTLKEVERTYIRRVLEDVEGNQTRAATILGISRKALWEKRRRYGMP